MLDKKEKELKFDQDKLIVVSQNLVDTMWFSKTAILRINLAWHDNLESVKDMLHAKANEILR